MKYRIEQRKSHFVVRDIQGNVIRTADNRREAEDEIELLEMEDEDDRQTGVA